MSKIAIKELIQSKLSLIGLGVVRINFRNVTSDPLKNTIKATVELLRKRQTVQLHLSFKTLHKVGFQCAFGYSETFQAFRYTVQS